MRLPKLWREGCNRRAAAALLRAGDLLWEQGIAPDDTGRSARLDLAVAIAKLRAELWTALAGGRS